MLGVGMVSEAAVLARTYSPLGLALLPSPSHGRGGSAWELSACAGGGSAPPPPPRTHTYTFGS